MSFFEEIRRDFTAPLERDPVGPNWLDVLFSYPGVHAVVAYRVIHRLQRIGVPVLPRFFAHLVRCATGIEIHPAARIGAGIFIDHGMGVVIGATTVIGENVTLYQGVTLGGTSLDRVGKRHPTLEDEVVVGVDALVLGNIRIGRKARIGAGAVVLKDVPSDATVVGVAARVVARDGVAVPSLEERLRAVEESLAQLEERLLSLQRMDGR
jgi:serine O-acetyltransferase